MKKFLLIILVVYVVAHVAYDRFDVDAKMAVIAADIRKTLPRTEGGLRIDTVEYSDRVMHYTGILFDHELTDEFKRTAEQSLRSLYCSSPALSKLGVGVEYVFMKTGARSISQKVSTETWSTKMEPADCR